MRTYVKSYIVGWSVCKGSRNIWQLILTFSQWNVTHLIMILHTISTTPLSRAKRQIWFSYIEVVTVELKINHMSRYSDESITVSDLLFLKCCTWRTIKSTLLYPTTVCIYIVAQRYWKLCLAGYVNHRVRIHGNNTDLLLTRSTPRAQTSTMPSFKSVKQFR